MPDPLAASLTIDPGLEPCPCRPALIWAAGIAPPFDPGRDTGFLTAAAERAAAAGEAGWPADIKPRVRRMLRHGRYKPAGRGKPASEFLLREAERGRLQPICAPVDVNNAVGLESGLPGSVFDAALCGPELLLRRGRPGEQYVFNRAGQQIALADLLLVCRRTAAGFVPCGNPVKDAMATKIGPATRDVLAVLYLPADTPGQQAQHWAARYSELLARHCAAGDTGFAILEPAPGATSTSRLPGP